MIEKEKITYSGCNLSCQVSFRSSKPTLLSFSKLMSCVFCWNYFELANLANFMIWNSLTNNACAEKRQWGQLDKMKFLRRSSFPIPIYRNHELCTSACNNDCQQEQRCQTLSSERTGFPNWKKFHNDTLYELRLILIGFKSNGWC